VTVDVDALIKSPGSAFDDVRHVEQRHRVPPADADDRL
jgi:hypothetical protein